MKMVEAARASLPWIWGYHMYKRTTGKRQWNTCEHGSIWCHDLCRADTRDIIDRHSLSCNELLTLFEPLGKNFSVGNPLIVNPSTSFLVESILAMTTSSFSLKCSPRSSQIGASCLQWPHHGASEEGTQYHTMLNCSWYGTAATQDRGYSQNNKDVFSLITSDLVEVLADQYLHWFLIPVIGNILCVQMRLYRRIWDTISTSNTALSTNIS